MRILDRSPHVTVEATPQAEIRRQEHWDGAVDAKVLPAPIHVKAKPSWSDWLRLMEFEDASADLRAARTSGDREWVRRASYRFQKANESMTAQVRFGERVVEAMRHVI